MYGDWRSDAFIDRRVLVTGGTSGIGLSVAGCFAELGAEVTAAGLDAAQGSQGHAALHLVELDVTADSQTEELLGAMDRLDVLVNCAGVIRRRDEYDPDVFRRVVEVNLTGTMRACLAARSLLAEAGGCIVNVASMTSFFGAPHAPAYGASKAAIVGLTKSLAMAYAPTVRVNAVAPGWIRTTLTRAVQTDPEADRRILERTPAGRWGEPSDVSGAVVFLASRAAAFITGVTLPVDGGYSAA